MLTSAESDENAASPIVVILPLIYTARKLRQLPNARSGIVVILLLIITVSID